MNEKPHISASQLGMYQRCGEQYRRRYIEGEKIPPGIAMLKGSGVHGAAKANFRQKKDSRVDLPKDKIVEAGIASFESAAASGVLLTQEEESVGYKKAVGAAKDSVAILSELYAIEVAPEYMPIYVEERHRIVTTTSHDLVAIMDLADNKARVVDLKTSGKKKNQAEVDSSEQLTFYSLVYLALTGNLPAEVRLETLVEKGQSERQLLTGKRERADLEALIARIDAMLHGLDGGTFIPASATSWMCDPRYCGYYMTCKFVSKRG